MFERMSHNTEFIIHRFNSKDFDEFGFFAEPVGLGRTSWKGNVLLNNGILKIWSILIGENIDSASAFFSGAGTHIGVGTSITAAASTQTGLQVAAASKVYQSCEAAYPSVTDQTVWFRAIFTSDMANASWAEFCVCNGLSDAAGTALNRAVSDQGVKASGQTWTIDVKITLD